MRIGTIGAGEVAQAVAAHAVRAGHDVILSNRRGPDALADVVRQLGSHASAGTPAEAAHADLVLLAVPWIHLAEAIETLGVDDWDGRIVVDATNQFTASGEIDDLGALTGSEHVASLLPGARVVKAFNTLYGRYIAANPVHAEGRQLLFIAGDDPDAKRTITELLTGFGFAPVDIGGLRDGGRLMQLGGPLSALHALKQG